MHDFNYHRPKDTAQAAALLNDDDAKLLAGGMSLLPGCELPMQRKQKFEKS